LRGGILEQKKVLTVWPAPFRRGQGDSGLRGSILEQQKDSAVPQSGGQDGLGLGKAPSPHSKATGACARQNGVH
jgi:hypothetical protein